MSQFAIASKRLKFLVVLAVLTAVLTPFPWIPLGFLRFFVAAILITQVWAEISGPQKLFLTSPLFYLAVIAAGPFSLFQGLAPLVWTPPQVHWIDYIGSNAERIVLTFALASLILHALVNLSVSDRDDRHHDYQVESHVLPVFLAGAVVALALFHLVTFKTLGYAELPFSGALRSLSPPIQAILVVLVIRAAVSRGTRFRLLALAVLAISVVGMITVHEGKTPVFLTLAALAYWMRVTQISARKLVLAFVAIIVFGVSAMQITQALRIPNASLLNDNRSADIGRSTEVFWNVLAWKAVWRQTDTGHCLKTVIQQHKDKQFMVSDQIFWLQGLVPRAIWPEKPSLSRGGEYTTKYCPTSKKGGHSSSITLLGQPIIHGGWAGGGLHIGILLLALGAIVRKTRDSASLPTAAVAALFPWLIDFDQDFAMYVANAVKFFLVMTPFIMLAAWSPDLLKRLRVGNPPSK